jgi:WD40 repeat protein
MRDSGQPFIVWDLAGGGVQGQISQALKPLEGLRRMAASFNGNSILILYENGQITRWAFTDPAATEQMIAQIRSMTPSTLTIRWSEDGSRLAFSGRYGGVDVWDPAKGQLVRHFDLPLDTPVLSPDGSKVVLFDPVKNTETIYDVATGSAVRVLADAAPVLRGPAFSQDGRYLAYAAGGRARLADLESVQIITLEPAPADQVGADMTVTRLIWSPDGQALVTVFATSGTDAGAIILWKRSADGTFEEVYHVVKSSVKLAIFNPSGSRVVLQSSDKLAQAQGEMMVVYDLAARKAILTLQSTYAGVWVNDEVLLLVSNSNNFGMLEQINVVSGNRRSGSGFEKGRNAYDPTGNFYMQEGFTSVRGIVILQWQESEKTKITARGIFETNGLIDYGWSPDGRWAYAVGSDSSVRIWPVVMH